LFSSSKAHVDAVAQWLLDKAFPDQVKNGDMGEAFTWETRTVRREYRPLRHEALANRPGKMILIPRLIMVPVRSTSHWCSLDYLDVPMDVIR